MREKLKVSGNKIVNSKGKEIILKGININSPGILKYEEKHDFLQDIKEIKKLGANAVRIPICPAYWQSKKNYCEEILNPIVNLTKKLNLYCCLDWHAQGNLFTGETRDKGKDLINGFKKYDASQELAFRVLEKLSKKYGKENHVIFDIFSMPIDIKDEDWINISKKLLNKVRNHTNNILVVNGTNWSSNLEWVLSNPLGSENIVYGVSYYPMVSSKDLDSIFKVKEKHPVLFSECGWTNEGYFKGTKEDYGNKLNDSILKKKISFFAWCYHPKRVPVLLNSWNPKDLTEWGKFVKEELLENKK